MSTNRTCAATMRTTLCLAFVLKPGAFGFGVYLMNSASLRVWSAMDPGVAEVTLAPINCHTRHSHGRQKQGRCNEVLQAFTWGVGTACKGRDVLQAREHFAVDDVE